MAQLLVRGLSDETVRRLRERAKARGRSLEAEHRAILEEALGKATTAATPAITTAEWAKRLQGTFLAELDPAKLRDDEPPREFHLDPRTGTTVRPARPTSENEDPDLPGCMSDGETVEEAIVNGVDAMRGWIEVMRAEGRSIPQPVERQAA